MEFGGDSPKGWHVDVDEYLEAVAICICANTFIGEK
jgi:hypothetical protein